MISAISHALIGYPPPSPPPAGQSGADVARLEAKVEAKQTEYDDCECADTRPRLRAELLGLKAELSSAKAEEASAPEAASMPAADAASQSNAANAYRDMENSTLSGESDRIGTVNFDEETPFGERVAYV